MDKKVLQYNDKLRVFHYLFNGIVKGTCTRLDFLLNLCTNYFFKFSILICLATSTMAQNQKNRWVDSVFQTLNTKQKVAQLFMLPVSSYSSPTEQAGLVSSIKKIKPGGLFIMQSGPVGHVALLNKLQLHAQTPLLTAISGEWGMPQSMDSIMSFARPLQMGAVSNDSLIFLTGQHIAKQMTILGIHLTLGINASIAPKATSYPASLYYFGDEETLVITKSAWLLRGIHSVANVLVAIKPFTEPQKLATDKSNEKTISPNFNPVDTIRAYPFQKFMNAGIDGMVTSSLTPLFLKKTDPGSIPPFTNWITKLFLQHNYNGLAIATISDIEKLTPHKRIGEPEKLAFEMGHDLLIDSKNISAGIRKIVKAIKKNPDLREQLEKSVKKILSLKYDVGLSNRKPLNTTNLVDKLHSPAALVVQHQLAEAFPTLVQNEKEILPIKSLENHSFASLSIGTKSDHEFDRYLAKYAPIKKFSIESVKDTVEIRNKIKSATHILVNIFPSSQKIISPLVDFLNTLSAAGHTVIISNFADPQVITLFQKQPVLLTTYTDDKLAQKTAAQIIFGALPAQGKLPLTVGEFFNPNQGLTSDTISRLCYALPEQAKLSSHTLANIKTIMQEAIDTRATPGCHVLVAKDGKVVYEQSLGYLTYDKKIPVTENTLYDLASVTKISATLQAVMFMHEKGVIDVNKKIAVYLPELRLTNKKDFTLKDILTHQAGLWPFLPFWKETIAPSTVKNYYYQTQKSEKYPFPVADSLYAHYSMKDSLWQWILHAKIRDKIPRIVYDYKYSDMGFYMLQHLAEKMLNQPLQNFLSHHFYKPIGAYTVGYLPREKFPDIQIAPTENDSSFRNRLLVGYVHDQGAAMHGGIAGHAGLFSNANDLAKLGQMWLQKGYYGGQHFLKPETLYLFTAQQYNSSRRGLGWDKPAPNDPASPTSTYASSQTFGHTGFTGTCIWVDPQFNLVYIFLSNRVYPDMNNTKIIDANIRSRIQDIIYQSIYNFYSNP